MEPVCVCAYYITVLCTCVSVYIIWMCMCEADNRYGGGGAAVAGRVNRHGNRYDRLRPSDTRDDRAHDLGPPLPPPPSGPSLMAISYIIIIYNTLLLSSPIHYITFQYAIGPSSLFHFFHPYPPPL